MHATALASLTAALMLIASASLAVPPEPFIDLGGPCSRDPRRRGYYREIKAALSRGDLQAAINYQKKEVLSSCDNPFRWLKLADLYVQAGEYANASSVLQEIDRRGLDIRPSGIEHNSALAGYIDTPQAQRLAGPQIISKWRAQAKSRRMRFRAKLSELTEAQRPASPYVAKDACPGEYCVLGTWKARKTTPLYEKPESSRVVGHAKAGTQVEALTGNVIAEPIPIAVIYDHNTNDEHRYEELVHTSFPKGAIVFLLDYVGEGFYNTWYRGRVISLDDWRLEPYCLKPSERCWAEPILAELTAPSTNQYPLPNQRHDWWVQIKTPAGVVGWTLDVAAFEPAAGQKWLQFSSMKSSSPSATLTNVSSQKGLSAPT